MAPSGPPAAKAGAADAKAKAKGEAKPKKEKKVAEEDEKPKMAAPDYDAHQEAVAKVQEKIDKLQKENAAVQEKLKSMSAGKEDFFSKKAVIRADLDAVSQEMNKHQEQRDQIRKMLGDKKEENQAAKQEFSKMKKSMNYTTEVDIDNRIAQIEDKMRHETLNLKQEKDFMLEIKELKKNRPKLSQLSQMQDKLSNLDAGTDLRAKQGELNEALALLREKKKGFQEKLMELTESRKAQLGDGSEMAERDERHKKIQALIAERSQLRDDFGAQKREFQVHLAEQRRLKQEKYAEDRKKQQEEWKIKQLEKKIENLDEQPHVAEIVLIEQTVKFCKSLLPQDAAEKKVEAKETVFNNKDGEMVLAKKSDRDEEMYLIPTKKKGGKKKGGGGDGETSTAKKPIKHNAETFKLFDSLKLDAPITTADIPALLEKLAEQMAVYEAKVKEWSENKEEMKRKIKEGIISMEDLQEQERKEEEEKKAAEKAEEKEEEKEEAKEE